MAHKGKKTAVIIGAGPAGLAAAHEMQEQGVAVPLLLEESDSVGGISKTVDCGGNRMDIGGHRFFSKSERVMQWWCKVMPLQAAPAKDELLLGASPVDAVPDPQKSDCVMLRRRRVSRIFFRRKFFPYPLTLSLSVLADMGFVRAVKAALGYLAARVTRRAELSLEDFYINRFGAPLYSMFFEDYTRKVWGKHPSQLGADWGSQRVKGLSVWALLKDAMLKRGKSDIAQKSVETSLIGEFLYPKYGPGQLWETVACKVVEQGGTLLKEHRVERVNVESGRVVSVECRLGDGSLRTVECDYLFSSMPLKELVAAIRGIDIPEPVARVAAGLPYRDFITVGLLVDNLKIKNRTALRTYAGRVPDTWIYVQERDVRVGRIQVFNNWSPYMVADYENSIFLGLEYFCNEGDELWQMSDKDMTALAVEELSRIGVVEASAVRSGNVVRIKKAYPAYWGSYKDLAVVRDFLDGIENLYCIGRNGQHRYNNMDHSMLTAFAAVDCIGKGGSKAAVWNVNTEADYHEE